MSDENDIYVNIVDDDGMCAWYNRDEDSGETFLHSATELVDWNTDEFAGTPLKSVEAARKAGSSARSLASWNGARRPRVRYYQYVGYKQVEVKFTKDGHVETASFRRKTV